MPRAEYEKLLNLTKKGTSEYALVSDYQSGDLPLVFQGKYANKSLVCDRDKFGETVKAYPWLDIFVLDVFPREQAKTYLKSVKRASGLFNLCRLRNISGAKKQSSGFRKLIFKANDIIHFFDLIGDKK